MFAFTYFGLFIGVFSSVYLLGFADRHEMFSNNLMFLFVCIVNSIQITTLIIITNTITKRGKINLFLSDWLNFITGFLFSLIYFMAMTFIPANIGFLDNIFFDLLVLPLLIFMPLIFINFLLLKRNN